MAFFFPISVQILLCGGGKYCYQLLTPCNIQGEKCVASVMIWKNLFTNILYETFNFMQINQHHLKVQLLCLS